LTTNNDIDNLSLTSLAFSGANYHITGRDFSLSGSIDVETPAPPVVLAPLTDTIDRHIDFLQSQALSQPQFLDVAKNNLLVLDGGMTVHSAANVTLSNVGTIQLGGNSDVLGSMEIAYGTLLVPHGSELDVNDNLTVDVTGTLTDSGRVHVSKLGGNIKDFGQINVTAAPSTGGPAGSLNDQGTLTVEHGGTLTDAGSVSVNGASAGAKVNPASTPHFDDFGKVAIRPTGRLDDNSLMVIEPTGTLDDDGAPTVLTVVQANALTVEAGAGLVTRGALIVEPDRTMTVLGTVVSGAAQPATLTATLTNKATPAFSLMTPGALTINDGGSTELNLTASADLAPTRGQTFTLVANATGLPINGLFTVGGAPLHEGDTVRVGKYDFTISYKGGAGNDVVLTYVSLHQFPVTITNKLSTALTVDGNDLPLYGQVSLVAGIHTLTDKYNPTVSLYFTVDPDGNVTYDQRLEGFLTGAGTSTLVVQGVAVIADSTGIASVASTFSVDGSPLLYLTGQVGTFYFLPGPFTVAYVANGTTTTLNFAVSAQDQVTFNPSDPSLNNLAIVQGNNEIVLQAPALQTFPITINSNILAQFGTFTYTLNGQTEKVGTQTFSLPVASFVITYQLPDFSTGALKTYTLTFTVAPDGSVTIPPGERATIVSGVLTLLPP
jgi:hypothetical protein